MPLAPNANAPAALSGAIRVTAARLIELSAALFAAAGSDAAESAAISEHLVDANLLGHDSHGVIRIAKYIAWAQAGEVIANRHATVAEDRGPLLLLDGGFGYGQVIGAEAMEHTAERAHRCGLAAVTIRNTGHLGRIGAWPEYLARRGIVSVHFVNTSGYGILVAPFGGTDRRLSANPVAAGAPGPNGRPIVLDIATSTIAEGKLQVARNTGATLPRDAVLDAAGHPTTDAAAFYGPPPGAILPFGGHKGSGLSFFCEILAGALSGGGSSHPENPTAWRLVNNMLTIAFDPAALAGSSVFTADLERLVTWVRGSPPVAPGGTVLLPGEIEEQTRAARTEAGIPLDAATVRSIVETADLLDVPIPDEMRGC